MRPSRGILGLATLLACAAVWLQLASTASQAIAPAALQAYESQLVPLVEAGGRTVEQGVKPGIDDLRNRHVVPPAMIVTEADTWIGDLAQVRAQVAALHVDRRLRAVNAAFVRALDDYIAACRTFRSAAAARQLGTRTVLLDRGVEQAVQADHVYDRAAGLLQGIRHQLKLPPSSSFPEPSRGTQQ